MLNTVATVVAAILGLHSIGKFAFLRCRTSDAGHCWTSSMAIRPRQQPRPIGC